MASDPYGLDDDDDPPPINFTFDGESQLGPLTPKKVRPAVANLRRLVEAFIAGGDVVPLENGLRNLFTKIEVAIGQLKSMAGKTPSKADFYTHNIQIYSRALEALIDLNDAIDSDDKRDLKYALGDFDDVVAELDRLVAKEG